MEVTEIHEIGVDEVLVGADEVRMDEIRIDEIVGIYEIGVGEVGADEVRIDEVRIDEVVGIYEIGVDEVRADEVGVDEVGVGKTVREGCHTVTMAFLYHCNLSASFDVALCVHCLCGRLWRSAEHNAKPILLIQVPQPPHTQTAHPKYKYPMQVQPATTHVLH